MVALNFNTQQAAPNVMPEALPSGLYPVMITESTEKPTAKPGKKPGKYIEFELTVQAGPGVDPKLVGRKVFDRLNIDHESQQTMDIAFSTLSAICHVTGRHNITDTAQLHGIPFMANVIKKPRQDDPSLMSNDVRGYKDINGNDPGFSGATQGGAAATPAWAGNGAAAAPPPPPPPPASNGAAFPPDGWVAHPGAPGHYYKGDQVLSEADLRAKVAAPPPPPPPPATNAAPPPPPPPGGAGTAPPPWAGKAA